MTNPFASIPGVTLTGQFPQEPPLLLVIGPEKSGKSTLSTSLVNWPNQGDMPLIIAADASGPDSCAKMGFSMPTMKIKDMPGRTFWEKTQYVLTTLENAKRSNQFPFTTIVIDCASTLAEKLHMEDVRDNPSNDPRKNYGNILTQCREFMHRILDLGLPTVWLAWLREPQVEEKVLPNGRKSKTTRLGGANIVGGFRNILAGKASMILPLEKVNVGPGAPGADETGYQRVLHTRTWDQIEGGGRYSHLFPEPCPAHLGWVINQMMGKNTQ
jgi:hypothetical protein